MSNVVQTNISAGQVGKRIQGRIDNPKFLNGLDVCKDFIPFIQGGGARRPGTIRVMDSVANWASENNTQIFGITVDDSDDYYFIEMSATSIRILKYNATGITLAAGVRTVAVAERATVVKTINPSPYADDDVADVYFNAVGREEIYLTHKYYAPRILNTVTWELTTVPFTCHPFAKDDDTDTELKITNESEIIALTSDVDENWDDAWVAASSDFAANVTYIEYKVNNEWFIGRCLDSNVNAAVPDPVASKIYVDPVEAVVIGVDPSARMVYVPYADADSDSYDEFRSDTLVFNYDMIGAWIRIVSDYDKLRTPAYADGNVYWGRISAYYGEKDIPTKFLTDPVLSNFELGHIYKITENRSTPEEYTVAAPSDKALGVWPANIDWDNGFTYSAVGDQFSWQNNARIKTSGAGAGNDRLDDLSSLKTFDVVRLTNTPNTTAAVSAGAGATSDLKLLQPTGNIIVLDRDTDPDGIAEHTATVTASRPSTFSAPTAWGAATAYVAGDYRNSGGRSYECIYPHTSDATLFTNDFPLHNSLDIPVWRARDYLDRYVQMNLGGTWVTFNIHTITSDQVVQVDLISPIPRATNSLDPTAFVNDGQSADWRMSAWGYRDYPFTITFYEQRLVFGGNPSFPHYVWASKIKDNYDLRAIEDNGEVLDTTGFSYPLSSTDLSAIKWMLPGPTLVIGTREKEWQVKPNSFGQALTSNNIRITSETEIGSSGKAVRAGSSIFFVERGGRGFRELYYDFSVDGFRTRDLMTISEDILGDDTIVDFAYQKFPNQVFWVVTNSGKVKTFTYDSENNFYAWADTGLANIKGVAVTPRTGLNFAEDQVWFSSTIVGALTGYGTVLALQPNFKPLATPDGYNGNMMFLDNATWYSADKGDNLTAGITGLDGLNWYAGQTVGVVVDGVYYGTQVVGSGLYIGELTLPATATKNITVGRVDLNSVRLKTLPHASAGPMGPNWGRLKRYRKVFVYMVDSLGGQVSDGEGTPVDIPFNDQETLVHGQTPVLFTGFKDLDYEWESGVDPRVEITTNEPYPMTILALGYEMESPE